MPAFDPVRDAVLNSPVVPPNEHPLRMHIDLPTGPPTRPSSSSAGSGYRTDSSPSVSTPLTRRATDLSVLLNSDPPPQETPLFTPTTPRGPATLSHILHHTDAGRSMPEERETLSNFAPLRRRSSGVESGQASASMRDNSYFAFQGGSSWPAVTAAVTGSPLTSLALPGSLPTPQPPTLAQLQPHPPSTRTHASPPVSAPPVNRSPVTPTLSNIVSPNPAPAIHPTSRPSSSHSPTSMLSRPSPATTPAPQRRTSVNMPPPPQPASHPVTPPPPSPRSPKVPIRAPPRQAAAPAPSLPPKPPAPTGLASLPPKPDVDPPPPFAVKRSVTPYAPKFRRTPAASVLVPLSPAEMERYRNFPGGVGTMLLRKRKREDGDVKRERSVKLEESADDEERRKRRKTGDVDVVVEHYNARPDVGVSQRQESVIIGLKSFNNWVKSVLITRFAHPALAESPISPAEAEGMGRGRAGERPGGVKGRVLDMGCGKGGDLTKWAKARIKEYVGVDIAAVSVEQASQRHSSLRSGPRFSASFYALDCYDHLLRDRLPPALLSRPFDVVSMQFCMHYAFESEKKVRCMLRNVSENLRPGGSFIGTIPDASQLLEKLGALPEDSKDLSFGNSVYTIRFEERTQRPLFGHRYWFFLRDAVDNVPEYVVHWETFVQMAADYGLYPTYRREFHQVFEEHHKHPEFAPLLERMHVVDKNGESKMDEDQWEAANIYIAFALEKR